MLDAVRALFAQDLAIDLGTAHTCVYAPGRGIVVNEPSIVALNTRSGRIEAIGEEAREMLGRTPENITAIRPMRDGVIADFDAAEQMLTHFIRKAYARSGWFHPRVVIGVPAEITSVERRAVKDSAMRAKVSEVHLVEESMAAAIGAGMPVTEAVGNMVVDIGGGTTDIAVISLSGVVYSRSLRIAGNELDEAIIQHARRAHNLLIGERMAERVKIAIGSAAVLDEPLTMEVKGRHVAEGCPTIVVMTDSEIRKAIADPVRAIIQAVRDALEVIPPELSADIYDRGIILTGGGAQLKQLDRRLGDETGLPIQLTGDPSTSVVLGAGRMLADADLLQRVQLD
ncbi:MAG: rod shape-determining protein [Vicinamibacterales bacterium]